MKYVIAFLLFWRDFILGDDKRIAIAVMWGFLAVYIWMQEFYDIWYLLPLIVMATMACLLILSIRPLPIFSVSRSAQVVWFLYLPLLACTTLPLLSFRLWVGDMSSEYVLLPLAIYSFAGLLYCTAVGWVFHKYPSLTSFISGIVAYATITWLQLPINQFVTTLYSSYAGISEGVAVVIVACCAATCIYAVRH